MQFLTKREYSAIQKALRQRPHEVPFNSVWEKIYVDLGVGINVGQKLILGNDDFFIMRKYATKVSESDPLSQDSGRLDRFEAASRFKDEKWADKNVFANTMRVNVREGRVPTTNGQAVTPPGTLLTIDATDLDVTQIHNVVIVENGIVAMHWDRCRIPQALESALMVYRGHGSETATVRQWLNCLPAETGLVGYFDFDPAGLALAVDYGVDAILVPQPFPDVRGASPGNKPEAYRVQIEHRPNLLDELPEGWKSILAWMMADQRECAVTQERITVDGRTLQLVDAQTGNEVVFE